MKVIEKEAKSEEEAINQVLKELGTENKELIQNIEVSDNNSKPSFLKFNKKLKVKVTIFDQREQEAVSVVKALLAKMNITVSDIKILEFDDTMVTLDLDTDKDSLLIGKRGKTLEAVQYLLNVILNRKKEEKFKVILDVENYREKRVKALQKLAQNLALKVRKTRKEKILEQMNPYERKIIHSTLQDEKDVSTESIGSGVFKKIKVYLKH
ncbi:MAG: KH domain-containing protein [Spirochaetes bacterium]|nr:KH domain-containing protein [Spirochaetota bacterium]